MITIEDACEIMLKDYKEKPYITGLIDVGQGYYIVVSYCPDEITADDASYLVYKDTGKKEHWFFPDHFEEIMNGKEIEIPKEYAYQKKS